MVDVLTQHRDGEGGQTTKPDSGGTLLLPLIPLHEHTLPLAPQCERVAGPAAELRKPEQSEIMELLTCRGSRSDPEFRLRRVAELLEKVPGVLPLTEEPQFIYHLSCVWGGIQRHAFRGTIPREPMAQGLHSRAKDAVQSVAKRLDELDELDLVHFVRGAAYLNLWNVRDMHQAAIVLAPRVAEMSSRNLSKVCDAFAASGIRNAEFEDALKQRLHVPRSERLDEYRGKDLARIAKYAGVVNLPVGDFEAPILRLARKILPATEIAHRMTIGWGLAAMESQSARDYVANILKDGGQAAQIRLDHALRLSPHVKLQFFQACLDLRLEPGPAFNRLLQRTTSILEPSARGAHAENRSGDSQSTRTQENWFERAMKNILLEVCGRGAIIRSQQTIGGISVDFEVGIPIQGHQGGYRMFVVECDGVRYHFVNSDPNQGYLGDHRMRQRILSRGGHAVVRVTSEEWEQCKDKHSLMRDKLRDGLHTFSLRSKLPVG